jgi:hypothetical protein
MMKYFSKISDGTSNDPLTGTFGPEARPIVGRVAEIRIATVDPERDAGSYQPVGIIGCCAACLT